MPSPGPGALPPVIPALSRYTTTVLRPQLTQLGVPPLAQTLVITDIEARGTALLRQWRDPVVRATLLLPTLEEAMFYEPASIPLDSRAFVVAVVRNSLLEDLGASHPVTPALRREDGLWISDRSMRVLTTAAVRFFATVDLAQVAGPVPLDRDRIVGRLATTYPRAWQVLSLLASRAESVFAYDPVPASRPRLAPSSDLRGLTGGGDVRRSAVDPAFDPVLLTLLDRATHRPWRVFTVPSWKSLTREPDKLFRTIEWLLSHDATLLTPNYVLAPTWLARRTPLLRAGHTTTDDVANLVNDAGCTPRHARLLRWEWRRQVALSLWFGVSDRARTWIARRHLASDAETPAARAP